MRTVFIITFLLVSTNISFCQTTPQEMANNFFSIYKTGKTDDALNYLFSSSPFSKEKEVAEGIEEVKRKLSKTVSQIGKFNGADLLATRTAGPNLLMLTYLVRHDREPTIFNIMFYRPSDKWQMQNFKYGGSIDDELEESSKAYRLKENYQ